MNRQSFLNYCLTHSGHLRLDLRLHRLVVSMYWKSFLFSVISTESKNFSLFPLENTPTKKARTHLQNSSCREISQQPPSLTSLFLTHSQKYQLILFYWIFNNRQKCFLGFFPQKISRKLPLKVEWDQFFSPYVLVQLPGALGDLLRVFHKRVGNHLLHFWPKPGPEGRPGWRYNMGDAGADFSSPEYFFQQCAWPSWLAELSLCRRPEVGNMADIISVFPCENKSLVILAKYHVPKGPCWFYEVGLSNWKVDWLTDSQIYKAE